MTPLESDGVMLNDMSRQERRSARRTDGRSARHERRARLAGRRWTKAQPEDDA